VTTEKGKKEEKEKGRERGEKEEEEEEEEEDGAHQLLEVITGELLLPHAINLAGEGGSPKLHLLQAQAMEEPQDQSTPQDIPAQAAAVGDPP
jgi:hypothetical protein